PPIPWQGNTSNVSSTFVLLRNITTRLEITAAKKPIKALWAIPTKPEPGVIATSPTTAPMQKPSTDGFLPLKTSKNIQDNPAAAAAILVFAKAETDRVFA